MIKLPSYFTGFSSKSDGSAGLRFATNEISPEDFAELKRNLNLFGWVCFQENIVPEVPEEPAIEEGKTQSQRLRATLFVFWKTKNITEDFESWKVKQVEKYIDSIKAKLDE
jgi:hypothetical protein